jgi:hypothetical protein
VSPPAYASGFSLVVDPGREWEIESQSQNAGATGLLGVVIWKKSSKILAISASTQRLASDVISALPLAVYV